MGVGLLFEGGGDGLSDAGVWLLYVQHGADGWCDVGDVVGGCCGSVLDVPSVEDEGDVCIVWVPCSVACAYVVGFVGSWDYSWCGDDEYVAAAFGVCAVDDSFA